MNDEVIERVARAIHDVKWPEHSFDDLVQDSQDWYRKEARAAIEAMRKPSPKMLKAACAAMSVGKRPTQKRVSVKAKHGIRYRAMIDAALGQEAAKPAEPKN